MVLTIAGTKFEDVHETTDEVYKRHPILEEYAKTFFTQDCLTIPNEHCLYVAQGECGIVPYSDKWIKFVGSDDATTCHIVIIKHPKGSFALSHLDTFKNKEHCIKQMVEDLIEIDGETPSMNIYVVGGYAPEYGTPEYWREESEDLSMKLLAIFVKHECEFQVELWCTCRLNTKEGCNGAMPKTYGIAIQKESGKVFPACFPSREPNFSLRMCSQWSKGDKKVSKLYDYKTGTITIEPFSFPHERYFLKSLTLPDASFIQRFSTSPLVEPPHFCKNVRESFAIIANHPFPLETLFPGAKPKKYQIDDFGFWHLVV